MKRSTINQIEKSGLPNNIKATMLLTGVADEISKTVPFILYCHNDESQETYLVIKHQTFKKVFVTVSDQYYGIKLFRSDADKTPYFICLYLNWQQRLKEVLSLD